MEGSVRSPGRAEVVDEQLPLAYGAAMRALTGCVASTARLDELLEQPQVGEADATAWWRLAGVT